MTAPLPNPIASLVLEDLRAAAMYLETLGDAPNTVGRVALDARRHANRLWNASQAFERLVIAVEQLVVQDRSRRSYEGNGNP